MNSFYFGQYIHAYHLLFVVFITVPPPRLLCFHLYPFDGWLVGSSAALLDFHKAWMEVGSWPRIDHKNFWC